MDEKRPDAKQYLMGVNPVHGTKSKKKTKVVFFISDFLKSVIILITFISKRHKGKHQTLNLLLKTHYMLLIVDQLFMRNRKINMKVSLLF